MLAVTISVPSPPPKGDLRPHFLNFGFQMSLDVFNADRKPGQLGRVVTGFDSKGVSIIPSDLLPMGKATIWTTDTVLDVTDPTTRSIQDMGIRSPNSKCSLLTYVYNFLALTSIVISNFHEMYAKVGGCVVVMEGGIEMHLDDNPLRFRSRGVNFPSRDPYFFSDTSRRYCGSERSKL